MRPSMMWMDWLWPYSAINSAKKVQVGKVVFGYFWERRLLRSRKLSKTVDFSLWGNRTTSRTTYIYYCTIFSIFRALRDTFSYVNMGWCGVMLSSELGKWAGGVYFDSAKMLMWMRYQHMLWDSPFLICVAWTCMIMPKNDILLATQF